MKLSKEYVYLLFSFKIENYKKFKHSLSYRTIQLGGMGSQFHFGFTNFMVLVSNINVKFAAMPFIWEDGILNAIFMF